MKRHFLVKRLFTGLLVVLWMLVIGSFSAQTGGESGGLSERVADILLSVGETLRGQAYPAAEREALIERMQYPVRKLAHMSEYGLLALLLVWHLSYYEALKNQYLRRLLLALCIAVLYAATDELHQRFVPGRSGQISDVCIDGAGALLGILFCFGGHRIFKKSNKNK